LRPVVDTCERPLACIVRASPRLLLFAERTPPCLQRRARAGCAAPRRRRASQGVWPRARRASST